MDKKKLTAALMTVAITGSSFTAFADFKDVQDGDLKEKIQALVDAGIVSGKGNGIFDPAGNMKRGELAKVIALALELPLDKAGAEKKFADVKGHWSAPYVGALVKAGITNGVAPNKFNPEGTVTRQELAVFFIRALGLEDEAEGLALLPQYDDAASIAEWAKFEVALAQALGLTAEGGAFGPTVKASRTEMVEYTYASAFAQEEIAQAVEELEKNAADLGDIQAAEAAVKAFVEAKLTTDAEVKAAEELLAKANEAIAKVDAADKKAELQKQVDDHKVVLVEAKAEVAVKAYEEAKLTTEDEVKAAEELGKKAEEAVANVTNAEKKAAFEKRIADQKVKVEAAKKVTINTVTVTGSKTLKVEFSTAVDTTKATVAVKKGSISVNVAKVTFAEDKKSATIELSSKLTAGEYTVSVSGLYDTAVTKTVTAENERVAKIEFTTTKAPLFDADADTSKDDLSVGYKVTNQYGEDITKTTALTVSATAGTPTASNGVVTINGNFAVDNIVTVTLIHPETATVATGTFTAAPEARVAEVVVTGLYNKDGKTLNEDTNLAVDQFYLLVEAKDQYGNVVSNPAQLLADLIINETNTSVVDAAAAFTTVAVDGVNKTALQLQGPVTVGESNITLISNTTGKNSTFKVAVAEATRTDSVVLQTPDLVVAGEDAYVPVEVIDKAGNIIKDVNLLNHATKGVKVTVGSTNLANPFVLKDGNVVIKVPSTELAAAGLKSLIAVSSSNKVATLTLNVKAPAVPTVITGLSSSFSKAMMTGGNATLNAGSFVIEDQYGRVMSSTAVDAWLGAANGTRIEIAEDTTSAVFTLVGTAIDATGGSVAVNAGLTKGTEKVTVTLHDGTKLLTASSYEFTLRATDGTEFTSYTVDDIATVYDEAGAGATDNAAYDRAINVYGVLADGSKVKLQAGTDYTVTSSDATVAADANADGIINATAAMTYASGATEVVVPITVTINATGHQVTKNVTFSKVRPKVASVAVVKDNTTSSTAVTAATHAATDDFDINDITTGAAGDYNIVVTDQYGVKALATTGTGTITFADGTNVATPTLTIVPVTGSVTITNNGLANAMVSGASISAGEVFDVKVTYDGGATYTVRVTAE